MNAYDTHLAPRLRIRNNVAVRKSLVAALVERAEQPLKLDARRFLDGLSADELQFIADYLGYCILESRLPASYNRCELVRSISEFQASCPSLDSDRKSILLMEYLQRIAGA
jgi:hypothetical protein